MRLLDHALWLLDHELCCIVQGLFVSQAQSLLNAWVGQALAEAATTVEEYLGHAAVYVHMSEVWYDKLYRHNVVGHTVSDVGVVAQLDDVMNSIMAKASDGAAEATAAAVARASFSALLTTLLHGGVFRNFVSDDADLLRRDVDSMKASSCRWLDAVYTDLIIHRCDASGELLCTLRCLR
jgi:hypothetical protein